jgi:pimeloyl-ACP methyl ester carboxylesterase
MSLRLNLRPNISTEWKIAAGVMITWAYLELSHALHERRIIRRFSNNIPNGPHPTYATRLLRLKSLLERLDTSDYHHIIHLGNELASNPLIRREMPEFLYHTVLCYVSATDNYEMEDFKVGSNEFEEYTDQVWNAVVRMYKARPQVDPFISDMRRDQLVRGLISKPRISRRYDTLIPSHDATLSLSVHHQPWVVHKLFQLTLRTCLMFNRLVTGFHPKPVHINGHQLVFWHRESPIPEKRMNVVIFFHGAFVGGPTFYLTPLTQVFQDHHIICYEIPNIRKLECTDTYPSIDIIHAGLMESIASIGGPINLSVVGHSLGCDFASSLVQYMTREHIGAMYNTYIRRDRVVLIEPFCLIQDHSFLGRRMAWSCPEKFPRLAWNMVIGNLYVQLAIKRSIPRSTFVWVCPYDPAWNGWVSKQIVTSKKDSAVVSAGVQGWVDAYARFGWTHHMIGGNHGGWVSRPWFTTQLKERLFG